MDQSPCIASGNGTCRPDSPARWKEYNPAKRRSARGSRVNFDQVGKIRTAKVYAAQAGIGFTSTPMASPKRSKKPSMSF
jgi:hypothetical protein